MWSWAKRDQVQRAQSAIMNSLTEVKEFDKLKVVKNTYKDSPRRPTKTKMPEKQTYRYCGSSHPLRQCLAYGKRCMECSKNVHFRVVCRSMRTRAVNKVEQEAAQDSAEENSMDLVNINSMHVPHYYYTPLTQLKSPSLNLLIFSTTSVS